MVLHQTFEVFTIISTLRGTNQNWPEMMDGLNWMDQPLAPVAFKVNRDYFCQGDVYVIRQLKEKTKFFMLPFAST